MSEQPVKPVSHDVEKNTDPKKAKGAFTIKLDNSYEYYVRNVSGITLDDFIAYLKSQGPLIRLNSRKVVSVFHIVTVEYDERYMPTYPEAEI